MRQRLSLHLASRVLQMSQSATSRQISSDVIRHALHDLQAPARHARAFLEMFRESTDEVSFSSEATELLQAAENAVDELREYFLAIRSVLTVPTSIESRQTVELASAVDTAWKSVEARNALSKGASLPIARSIETATNEDQETKFLVEGSASVESEESLVVAMLMELLDNAQRYRKAGDSHAIHCKIESHRDASQIQIIDNGQGIEPQKIDSMMQPFQRGYRTGGIGLGLTRCTCIAQTIGCQVRLQSDGASGTTAIVSIPLKRESS